MTWTIRQRSDGAGALRYFEEGAGQNLVLIHGVGLRAEAWCGVLPFLTDSYRVICVDMPGHGESPLQDSDDLADFCARLQSFIMAMEGPVFLAGHSMGALLAVQSAVAMPDNVEAIAALNMVFRRSKEATAAVQERAAQLTKNGAADPAPTLQRWFGETPNGPDADAAAACRDWLTRCDPEGYAAAYRVFAHHDGPSYATLSRLACPALFLTGDADPNSTPDMSRALATGCGGRCDVLANAAHMMPMTHTREVAAHLAAHFWGGCVP